MIYININHSSRGKMMIPVKSEIFLEDGNYTVPVLFEMFPFKYFYLLSIKLVISNATEIL